MVNTGITKTDWVRSLVSKDRQKRKYLHVHGGKNLRDYLYFMGRKFKREGDHEEI